MHPEILKELFGSELSKANKKKMTIAEATIKLLYTAGYSSVTFQDIADASEMTKGSVHYYFNKIEELLLFCFKLTIAQGQQLILKKMQQANKKENESSTLENLYRATFDWAKNNPSHIGLYLHMNSLAKNSDAIREILTEVRKQGVDRTAAVLVHAHRMDPTKAEVVAQQIRSIVTGSIADWWGCGQKNLNNYESVCIDFIKKIS